MKNIVLSIAAILLFSSPIICQLGMGGPAKVVKGVTILLPEVVSNNNIEYWTPPGRTTPVLPDYAPVEVCSEYAPPGSRGMNGRCSPNYYQKIPLNSPASYNCDKAFGAGRCTTTDFYVGEPVRYIPTCPAGFQYVGGYTVTPNGSGGWAESVSKFKEGDQYYYVTRGQILCARLTSKRPVVTSFDGPYNVQFAEEGGSELNGSWVPTRFEIKIEGDSISGNVVSKAGTHEIVDGKIVEQLSSLDNKTVFRLASFTVTVDDVDYTYESDAPMNSNITLAFNVSWTDADGGSHKGFIRLLRPNEWLIKNRPNIPQ